MEAEDQNESVFQKGSRGLWPRPVLALITKNLALIFQTNRKIICAESGIQFLEFLF